MSPRPPPDVVALAGPNGAGKSTVGPALLRESLGLSTFVNALGAPGRRLPLSHRVSVARQPGARGCPGARSVRAGGHAVPEDVVRRRYRVGLRNFFELYRPMTTTWQVYDNSSESAARIRLISLGRGEAADAALTSAGRSAPPHSCDLLSRADRGYLRVGLEGSRPPFSGRGSQPGSVRRALELEESQALSAVTASAGNRDADPFPNAHRPDRESRRFLSARLNSLRRDGGLIDYVVEFDKTLPRPENRRVWPSSC